MRQLNGQPMGLIPQLSLIREADRLQMWANFGRIAFECGEGRRTCPADLNAAHRRAWLGGWDKACAS